MKSCWGCAADLNDQEMDRVLEGTLGAIRHGIGHSKGAEGIDVRARCAKWRGHWGVWGALRLAAWLLQQHLCMRTDYTRLADVEGLEKKAGECDD